MNFLITGLETFETKKKCVPRDLWLGFASYFTVIDMVITMLLPFIIISITNTLITVKLLGMSFWRRYKKWLSSSNKKSSSFKNTMPLMDIERITEIHYENKKLNGLTYINDTNIIIEASNYEMNSCVGKKITFIDKIVKKKYWKINKRSKKGKTSIQLSKVNKSNTSFEFDRNQRIINRASTTNLSKREKVYSRTTKVLLSLSTMFLILVKKFLLNFKVMSSKSRF